MGLLVWVLYYAYFYFNISLVLWILLYISIAIYWGFAIAFVSRKYGFHRFITHSLMLQLVPICATIFTFWLISESTVYTPIEGKTKIYERSFNDLQDKQKAAAIANGLAPFESSVEIEENYNKLRRKGKLVHIESNPKYIVRELISSSP